MAMKKLLTAEELRIKAIEEYKKGKSVTEICRALGCSRQWLYKWIKRYNTKDAAWYKEESKKPKNIRRKRDKKTEEMVLEARKELVTTPFRQYGPQAIFYHLTMKDKPSPPVWEIARILKNNNATISRKKRGYVTKGKDYPYDYDLAQQMDFVGPRYLESKIKFYCLNIISLETHYAQVSIYQNQGSENVCKSLIKYWKVVGFPDFLQMDNDLSFWGSLVHPGAVGRVIRLCLIHGVIPVFIPVREPWRNGMIEHFNNTMQNAVLKSFRFDSLEKIQEKSDQFCLVHNRNHRYRSQGNLTPMEYIRQNGYPHSPLREDYQLSDGRLPLPEGEIHVVRFVRSDLKYILFKKTYVLPERCMHEYVLGKIITGDNLLNIYIGQEYITRFAIKLF